MVKMRTIVRNKKVPTQRLKQKILEQVANGLFSLSFVTPLYITI